eukprot:344812_1
MCNSEIYVSLFTWIFAIFIAICHATTSKPSMEPTIEPTVLLNNTHINIITNQIFSNYNGTTSIISHNTNFINCVFQQNENIYYSVMDNINVNFINCTFENNILITFEMIYSSSMLSFHNCLFNNIQNNKPLFNIHSGSLLLDNITFTNSIGTNTNFISINPYHNSSVNISITNTRFSSISSYHTLVFLNDKNISTESQITFDNCIFNDIKTIIIYHEFISIPHIRVHIISSSMNNNIIYFPFLINKYTNNCTTLPSFTNYHIINSTFINNILYTSLFKLECSNILFESNQFISNKALLTGNLLCYKNLYNIVQGSASIIDNDTCTLKTQFGNTILWFGSADGNTPNHYFDYLDKFVLTATFQINQATKAGSNGGIILRTPTATTGYFAHIQPQSNIVVFRKFDPGWGNVGGTYPKAIGINITYELRVEADGSNYKIYLNNSLIMTRNHAGFTFGSIGLRTGSAVVTYYSLTLVGGYMDHTMNIIKTENKCGLIDISGGNHMDINDCIFDRNMLINGLIYDESESLKTVDRFLYPLTTIYQSIFNNNMAFKGAIMYINGINSEYYTGASYIIDDCDFNNNSADSGAVIYANVYDINFTKSIIIMDSDFNYNNAKKK